MAILDLLLEKKDVIIYIDVRIKMLKREQFNLMKTAKPSDRGFLQERFKGRIDELEIIRNLIKSGQVKDAAKKAWKPLEVKK